MNDNSSSELTFGSNQEWKEQANYQSLSRCITDIKQEEASEIRLVGKGKDECTFLSEQQYSFNHFLIAPTIKSEDVKTEITEEGTHSKEENRSDQLYSLNNFLTTTILEPEDIVKTEISEEPHSEGILRHYIINQEPIGGTQENRIAEQYPPNNFSTTASPVRPEDIVKTEISEELQTEGSLPNCSISKEASDATKEIRTQQQYLFDDFSIEDSTVRPEDFVKTEITEEGTSGENLGLHIANQELQGPTQVKQGIRTPNVNTTTTVNPDVKTHECHNCNYKTIRKSDMTRHQLTHQGIEAMLTRKVYECDFCKYKSIRKCDLQRHKLVHKGIDDIDAQVYECSFCSYKSHRKNDLVRHTLIHKGNEEVNLFKCTYCPFQSKWRESFQQHIKSHMKPEDLDFYQCEYCGYQTINKKHLRSHQLTHKSEEEVKMFNCGFCSYNSKHKCNLQRHLKTHTNVETKLVLPKLF